MKTAKVEKVLMSEKTVDRIIAISILIAFVGILGLVYGTATSDTTLNQRNQIDQGSLIQFSKV